MTGDLWASLIYGGGALLLGACTGSFLNVVIYRLPHGMSVHRPTRSFCPSCKKQIPWYLNIPLISWIQLRGKCAYCGAGIAFRYFLVELVTALFFVAIWIYFPWQVALIYWILISLLLAATFIDLEHYIIPDSITIGGAITGMICAAIVPQIMGQANHLHGLGYSALGAVAGYGSLWIVVHLGKLAFGRLKHTFDEPVAWSISQEDPDDEPVVKLGDEESVWSDYFSRPSDRIIIDCRRLVVHGKGGAGDREFTEVKPSIYFNRIEIGREKISLENVESIEGTATEVVTPREAMGFGDVKFMATIGAFLGWQAVVFTVLAGSVTGALVGGMQRLIGRETWSKPIPFGPYLAFGAVIWMFYGWDLLRIYLNRVMG